MMDSKTTAFILLPISLIGFAVNWAVMYACTKVKTHKHSFILLTGSQAFADAVHATAFLFYYTPMVVFDSSLLIEYSPYCGYILLLCYELSVYTHLIISVNRFLAAYTPFYFRAFFRIKNTRIILVLAYLIISIATFFFYGLKCHMFYSREIGFFFFTDTPFCNNVGWYWDFLKNCAVLVLIFVFDLATLYGVKIQGKKMSTTVSERTNRRAEARERTFLYQAILQDAVFLFEIVSYFIFPKFLTNKWLIFFSTSFSWVAIHAIDGIITVVCNKEVRKFIFRCGKQRQNSTATTSETRRQNAA